MSAIPFMIVTIRNKRDALALRQQARQVAQLLRFDACEQACIAAGAFAVAMQALTHLEHATVCFRIESGQLQVFVQTVAAGPASHMLENNGGKVLLRLVKALPSCEGFERIDVGLLVGRLVAAMPRRLFEEVVKQNQEILTLLHELQTYRAQAKLREVLPASPSAA